MLCNILLVVPLTITKSEPKANNTQQANKVWVYTNPGHKAEGTSADLQGVMWLSSSSTPGTEGTSYCSLNEAVICATVKPSGCSCPAIQTDTPAKRKESWKAVPHPKDSAYTRGHWVCCFASDLQQDVEQNIGGKEKRTQALESS